MAGVFQGLPGDRISIPQGSAVLVLHPIKTVFLHVPKCSGKEVRKVFQDSFTENEVQALWGYEYSNILHRYVDLAHLPLSDLRNYEEFYSYLDRYHVIACVRNPYYRLPSAVNEYYRQLSSRHAAKANKGRLSRLDRERYYLRLIRRHTQQDPRFIHSLPIYYFTHHGTKPKVDTLLRCERIRSDFLALGTERSWPSSLLDLAASCLQDRPAEMNNAPMKGREKRLCNQMYAVDFQTFGYKMSNLSSDRLPLQANHDYLKDYFLPISRHVAWHGGAKKLNQFPEKLQPVRLGSP